MCYKGPICFYRNSNGRISKQRAVFWQILKGSNFVTFWWVWYGLSFYYAGVSFPKATEGEREREREREPRRSRFKTIIINIGHFLFSPSLETKINLEEFHCFGSSDNKKSINCYRAFLHSQANRIMKSLIKNYLLQIGQTCVLWGVVSRYDSNVNQKTISQFTKADLLCVGQIHIRALFTTHYSA